MDSCRPGRRAGISLRRHSSRRSAYYACLAGTTTGDFNWIATLATTAFSIYITVHLIYTVWKRGRWMSIKNSFFIVLLLCPLYLQANEEKQPEGFYKITTPDGHPVYTDQKPREDQQAEKIIPPELQTIPSNPVEEQFFEAEALLKEYDVFNIISPGPNETLHNIDSLILTTQIQPNLFPGDFIQLSMNGEVIKANSRNKNIAVTLPGRGSYSFVAKIFSQDKQLLKSAGPITVHIKKHSVLFNKD